MPTPRGRRWWPAALVVLFAAGVSLNVGLAGAAVQTAAAKRLAATTPDGQTPSEFDDDAGGEADADDPKVWVHPTNSSRSIIIGTLKHAGMAVYDLSGKQIQRIAADKPIDPTEERGKLNNVEIIYGLSVGGRTRDLVVVSENQNDEVRIFAVDAAKAGRGQAPLVDVTASDVPHVFSRTRAEVIEGRNAYGLTAYKSRGTGYALVTREEKSDLALVKLVSKAGGKVGYTVERRLTLPSTFTLPNGRSWKPCEEPDGRTPQAEGLAVDVRRGVAYVSQELVGVWKVPMSLSGAAPKLMDKAKTFGVPGTYNTRTEECTPGRDPGYGGTHLTADIEGITIYHRAGGLGYLIVSSQGDSTYAVYDLVGSNRYLGSFKVTAGAFDGTEESDGLTVVNVPVGRYSQGLAVIADGNNTPAVKGSDGKARDNTNFKMVSWSKIARSFSPPLKIDTRGYNPRR